jgi:hypothetical protein
MPWGPAWTRTSSPVPKRIRERLSARVVRGWVSSRRLSATISEGTPWGGEALAKVPLPAKT